MVKNVNETCATAFSFGTKAETLANLFGHLNTAKILPVVYFTIDEWLNNSDGVIERIDTEIGSDDPLIVRSSASGEDRVDATQAGHFLTLTDVEGKKNLRLAICKVFESCAIPGTSLDHSHQVLVQPMLTNTTTSGVVFTCDPNTAMPYIVINYEQGPDTTGITGGTADRPKTFYFWKHGDATAPDLLNRVVQLADELETLFHHGSLDFEFAFDDHDDLYLFQVRRLVLPNSYEVDVEAHTRRLEKIANKIALSSRTHPFLYGERSVFGVMPDWNPAEIIGIRPRPLALALYRELITDSIWAYQRDNYGYKNLRSFPLLFDFHGLPYVDVRVSFNSFLPKDITDGLADQLIDYYIDRLTLMPALHDKIEFEIVFSCYTFDLNQRLNALNGYGFSVKDKKMLADSLRTLTNNVINHSTGLWKQDLERIEKLKSHHEDLFKTDMDKVSRVYWLLENCKRYGTMPFAGLARAGFMAVQILQSMVKTGILATEQVADFMSGLETVSGDLIRDLHSLDRDTFLDTFGHLRPGTYDIRSPRYDEMPDLYFDWSTITEAKNKSSAEKKELSLSAEQTRRISAVLVEHNLQIDVDGLFSFIESAIKGREYAKFVFTQSLSDALSLIRDLGAENGFSVDDMSYMDIRVIYALYSSSVDIHTAIANSINRGKAHYHETQQVLLPPLITEADEVWGFHLPPSDPNFITQNSITAPVRRPSDKEDLAGSIILIPNADPGFDWIFTRGIAGFATAYGGANSHMAIRASELDLPAVIGAGELLFEKWSSAQMLELDCANRLVRILK